MKGSKLAPHLGVFFILAVVIPSIALSVIAIRSLSREEAYIEKQTQRALMTEVIQVASRVENLLEEFKNELSRSLERVYSETAVKESFSAWKRQSSLVQVPFLVSAHQEILWPRSDEVLTEADASFLNWNKRLLSDEMKIPVYQNIAVAFKNEILKEEKVLASGKDKFYKEEVAQGKTQELDSTALSTAASRDVSYAPSARENRGVQVSDAYESQQAISEFERSEPLRKKVYEQAKQRGQQVLSRKVQVSASADKKADARQEQVFDQQSIFISQPLTFSQIIANADSGIIPRFIEDKLTLLFWKKRADESIVGCVINQEKLKEKIIAALPPIYSSTRILTVLDENGRPLIAPTQMISRNWRRPFAAREISAYLPHWEVAAYLTDPHSVSVRAHAAQVIMWMLISILFVSIVSGGTLVLRSLHSEMALAQQKTTFVANVSHELKTPLTSIRMFAEMLKEKRQPDEQKREKYLDIMASETERLTRLINNVLDFSRMTQGKIKYNMKAIDIVSLSMNLFESQKLRLENNGYEVNFKKDIEHLEIRADEEAIKQAILNLISNAERYCTQSKKIDFEVTRMDKFAIVNIKDRGIGIPPKDVKKIFKAFYRVDDTLTSKVRGTGLGLTIARQIIRDHGGDIEYFARDGGGSIFQIKLPI